MFDHQIRFVGDSVDDGPARESSDFLFSDRLRSCVNKPPINMTTTAQMQQLQPANSDHFIYNSSLCQSKLNSGISGSMYQIPYPVQPRLSYKAKLNMMLPLPWSQQRLPISSLLEADAYSSKKAVSASRDNNLNDTVENVYNKLCVNGQQRHDVQLPSLKMVGDIPMMQLEAQGQVSSLSAGSSSGSASNDSDTHQYALQLLNLVGGQSGPSSPTQSFDPNESGRLMFVQPRSGSQDGNTTEQSSYQHFQQHHQQQQKQKASSNHGKISRKRQSRMAEKAARRCHACNVNETPEWRRGPDGARTLCNACGLTYAKLLKKSKESGIDLVSTSPMFEKNSAVQMLSFASKNSLQQLRLQREDKLKSIMFK
ncbi:hypothetical protein MIR68_005839 [Amoeboaphelidium protococcarum]|nr:hypothetical protein MIR68_005839 [Amoeboaphelidium protococcarum]